MTGLPCRLSTDDPQFHRWAQRLVVYLDGAEVPDCRAYDTQAGWVRTLQRDRGGQVMHVGGRVVEALLHGRVEVAVRK